MNRLKQFFSRNKMRSDLSEEMQQHLDEKIEALVAQGMPRDEAIHAARRAFGNATLLEQRSREVWMWPVVESLWADVKFALRQLRKSPGFTATAILTISLGIGLNTSMFSVIRAVLFEPLGYHDPDRLILLSNSATPIRFEEMLSTARSYDGLGAYAGGREDLALSGNRQPEVLKGARVSGDFLDVLGVQPLLGRSFLPAEDKPGAPAVAMISAELWQRRFNRGPILGRSVTLAGTAYTVIGVLPAKFQFPFAATDVWLTQPSEWSVLDPPSRRISPILHVFGRLKASVCIPAANAELLVIDHQYDVAHPGMLDSDNSIARSWHRPPDHVERLKDQLVSDVRPKLWLLFGAVGLVLLIVCANVASLLLARATARSREFAVRVAIGAGRWRIIGQVLTESILLSLIGGAFGVALAELSVRTVRGMTALDLPRSGEIRIDGAVLFFAVVLSLLTALLFGLAPSLSASRPNLAGMLRGSGEGTSSANQKSRFWHFNPRSLLIIGQVALSTVLLIGAALLIESLARVYRVDPGFQVSNLLTMSIALSPTRYNTNEKRSAFYDEMVESIESLPGVEGAAITRTLPMTGWAGVPVQVIGRPNMKLNERPIVIYQEVTPKYFQTMKIPLKRGREFTAHDDAKSVPVAIIDESMARHFWPQYPNGPDPVGQHILVGAHSPPTEIIGIAADIRQRGLDSEPTLGVYRAAAQDPPEAAVLAVRTEGDPLSFANAVRNQILTLDRDQAVSEVSSMNQVVDESEGQLRVMMTLLGIFAGAATTIAVVGLYGVIAYSVTQRTKEIGIRRALGAQRGNILALVIGYGLRLALIGLLLGICGAFALTRVLQGLLFQISTTDPLTYAGIAFLFVVVAVAASYVPARRAASVDPMQALRSE